MKWLIENLRRRREPVAVPPVKLKEARAEAAAEAAAFACNPDESAGLAEEWHVEEASERWHVEGDEKWAVE